MQDDYVLKQKDGWSQRTQWEEENESSSMSICLKSNKLRVQLIRWSRIESIKLKQSHQALTETLAVFDKFDGEKLYLFDEDEIADEMESTNCQKVKLPKLTLKQFNKDFTNQTTFHLSLQFPTLKHDKFYYVHSLLEHSATSSSL